MKKLIYCALALAAGLFAASCQQENLEPVQGGNTVTFTVEIPEVATKAIGDAENVNNLVYAVYRVTGENEADAKANLTPEKFVYQDHNSVLNGKSTVSLELINDQAYLILFWAQVGNTWFDNEYQFGTEKVTYPTGLVANNDKYSAFYGVSYIDDVKGPATKDITLHRPFAQINVATNDPENYNVVINKTSVTVANAASGFDVAKEEAIVTPDYSVSFEAAQMPENEILTVNNVTYKTGVQNTGSKENDEHHYVAMNYVFAAGNVNVSYVIDTDHGTVSNTINNVPVAKNYRTNIVGGLLTSDVDYNVTLDKEWGGSDENVNTITDGLAKIQSTGEYMISNANGLAYASKNCFAKGGSYILTADIDMSEYTALETKAGDKFWESVYIDHKTFSFDGKGYSISNLPGMFVHSTNWGDLTIKNLTLNNPKIAYDIEDKSDKGVGAFFGFIDSFNKILVENCHVKGGEITGGHWTGGLIGYAAGWTGESTLTIKNCSVKDATVTGKGSCGGIIGHANGGTGLAELNTISVFSSTIESTGTDTNKAGSVMGTVGSGTVKVTNCSVIDNEVTSNGVSNTKLWGRQGSSTGVLYVDDVQVEDFGTYTPSTTVTVTNDEELAMALAVTDFTVIKLASGTYSNDIKLTVAELVNAVRDIKFEAAEGAEPVIAGTVTLGYFENRVGAEAWNGMITFDGITFDHANPLTHSLSIQNVMNKDTGKGLVLENCTVIGDGEYGISAPGSNPTGQSSITNCTFVNAGLQLGGNYATGLIIEDSKFDESCINVQGGNSVTIQNCSFKNTLTNAHIAQSFYLIRSNATPITVKNCVIAIDSELSEVATNQANWGMLWNRKDKDWTVENVAVTMTDAALMQTELLVTKCASTGKINTTNLTVNGKAYASTAEQLTAAVNNGATDIVLAGQFEMPGGSTDKAITFTSLNGTAVIDNTKGSYWEAATLTFNNISFKTGTGMVNGNGADYAALYSKNVTYNNCTFTGPMRLGRDGAKFNACTFNGLGNDYVWTYGKSASFDGCTFNTDGKAILIYSDGPTGEHGAAPAVSVTNCTFNATQGAKAGAIVNQNCAAVEIHNYGNGVTLTTSGNTVDEDFSGVWRIKTYENRFPDSKIFVNGTEYTTIALDGKTMTIDANKNVTVL